MALADTGEKHMGQNSWPQFAQLSASVSMGALQVGQVTIVSIFHPQSDLEANYSTRCKVP
jgi:hypothetical protein